MASATSCLADVDGAVVLPAGADAALSPGEAHVYFVFDTLDLLKNIRFTPPGKKLASFAIDRLEPGVHAYMLRMRAGQYCLANFHSYGSPTQGILRWSQKDKSQSNRLCFEAADGALNYAGTFAVRGAQQGGVVTIAFQPVPFLVHVSRDYAAILSAHARIRSSIAVGERSQTIGPTQFAQIAFEMGERELGTAILERAAAANDTETMIALGARYLEGRHLEANLDRGLDWWKRAAETGDDRAVKLLCDVGQQLEIGTKQAQDAQRYCERLPGASDLR